MRRSFLRRQYELMVLLWKSDHLLFANMRLCRGITKSDFDARLLSLKCPQSNRMSGRDCALQGRKIAWRGSGGKKKREDVGCPVPGPGLRLARRLATLCARQVLDAITSTSTPDIGSIVSSGR